MPGGTGFYIQAVVKDIDFSKESEKSPVREELEKLAEEKAVHISMKDYSR